MQQVFQRWKSDKLPWEVFPLTMWDTASDVTVARAGRARTAATRLIRYPDLRTDDRLIAAAAQDAQWAADVLIQYPNIRDDRLIAAAAQDAQWAADVLIQYPNIRDDRLIAAAAQDVQAAAWVLRSTDWYDDRLIDVIVATVGEGNASWAAKVIISRPDIRDTRPIDVIVQSQSVSWATTVLTSCADICDDRLIATAVKVVQQAEEIIAKRPDLRFHPSIVEALVASSTPRRRR